MEWPKDGGRSHPEAGAAFERDTLYREVVRADERWQAGKALAAVGG